MILRWKKEAVVLLMGDIMAFCLAIFLTLIIRFWRFSLWQEFADHLYSFSWIFIIWVFVFFINGLYDKQTNDIKSKLPKLILNSQIVNGIIAALFFYFQLTPNFPDITPKTNLLIYLTISTLLILFWRMFLVDMAYVGRSENTLLVGAGPLVLELSEEIKNNSRYRMNIKQIAFLDQSALEEIKAKKFLTIIMDSSYKTVDNSNISEAILLDVKFIDIKNLYEEIFKKAPLSFVDDRWFLENISNHPKIWYEIVKRIMDFIVATVLGIFFLVVLPFLYISIKLEDGGVVFIKQERIGKGNNPINVLKLRSMKVDDLGKWPTKDDLRITKVGKFLRKTRLDEFPQLWNVLKGDISLIGPRPDIVLLGLQLQEQLKYYKIRTIIKPGLSGWAQINQELPPHSLEETRERLAYDFFYIKNRSFLLDLEIALKTIKTLLSRAGS